jgi:hypothetical protein
VVLVVLQVVRPQVMAVHLIKAVLVVLVVVL